MRAGDAWKLARYDSVTCSDLSVVMGVNRDLSRQKLFKSKLDRIDPLENCGATLRMFLTLGNEFEPAAKSAFERYWSLGEGKMGYTPGMTVHPTYDWFTGTPDYVIPESGIIVEFKTHWWPSISEASPIRSVSAIPLKYYLQVQGYLEIYGYDKGFLFSWTMANGWRMYMIQRDKALMAKVIQEAHLFYGLLQSARKMEGPDHAGTEASLKAANTLKFKRGEKARVIAAVYGSMMENTWPLDHL